MAPYPPPSNEKGGSQSAPFTICTTVKSRTAKIADFQPVSRASSLVWREWNRYLTGRKLHPGSIGHACNPRHRPYRSRSLHLALDRRGDPVLADRLQRGEHAQPVRVGRVGIPLP